MSEPLSLHALPLPVLSMLLAVLLHRGALSLCYGLLTSDSLRSLELVDLSSNSIEGGNGCSMAILT